MICIMYEKATKIEPANEELLSQLFMSYVRVGAYKKQQTAAMALYKLKAKTPYYFWAVMSVVLQAKASEDEKTANSVILPLAERMIAKIEKDGKMDQEQETRLYLMVLEMQQKYNQALQVLDTLVLHQCPKGNCHLISRVLGRVKKINKLLWC